MKNEMLNMILCEWFCLYKTEVFLNSETPDR